MEEITKELVSNPPLIVIATFGVIIAFFLIYRLKFSAVAYKKGQVTFSASDPEVVIVGGGLTGASLAAALGKHGRRVVVIERDMSVPITFRGEGLQPGGVQALEDMGLIDVVGDYHGMPFAGMIFIDQHSEIKTKVTFPRLGKTAHHGNLVEALRKYAASLPAVKFIEGTGTDLLRENKRVIGVKYRLKGSQDSKTIHAPLTVISDGYYSNLRGEFPGVRKQTLESYVVGLELNNVEHLQDTYAEIICGLPTAQMVSYRLNEETSRLLLLFNDNPPTNIGNFLESKVAPSLPAHFQKPLLETLKHTRAPKCIQGRQQGATYEHIPGALLLGDALSRRDPVTAAGMTAALKDVRFWQKSLSEIPDLADDLVVMRQKEFYGKKRRIYTWPIDIIAHVFITLAKGSDNVRNVLEHVNHGRMIFADVAHVRMRPLPSQLAPANFDSSVRLREAFFKNIKALENDVPVEKKEAAYSLFALISTDSGLLKKFLFKTCADAVLQCIRSNSWITPWVTVKESFGIVFKFWKIMSVDI